MKEYKTILVYLLMFPCVFSQDLVLNAISKIKNNGIFQNALGNLHMNRNTPCTCGIFLDGQLLDGNELPPETNPVFSRELNIPMLPCGTRGNKLCSDRCLDLIVPHMATSGPLICASLDRDCYRERASLFIRNCDNVWRSTGLTMGKEFCCTAGHYSRCPKGPIIAPRIASNSFLSDILDGSPSNSRSLPEIILDLADKAADIATDVLQAKK